MSGALRNFLGVLAALLLSAGHVACACLAAAAPLPPPATHAQHHETHEHGQPSAPSHHREHGDCDHCESVGASIPGAASGVLAGVKKVADAPGVIAAPLASVRVPRAERRALRWRPPDIPSPVEMKIRLRN